MKYLVIIFLVLIPAVAFAGSDEFAGFVMLGQKILELEARIAKLEQRIKELEGSGCTTAPVKPEPPGKTEPPEKEKPTPPPVPPERPAQRFGVVEGTIVPPKGEPRLDAYVYLDGVNAPLAKEKTVRIEQVERQFSPRFLVVEKGTIVEFPNKDAIYHNVFSPNPENKFDVGFTRSGEIAASRRLTSAGVADIYCNIHGQMSALVVVTPNDRIAHVDKKTGKFSLLNIPIGPHTFVFVASDGRRSEATMNVVAGPPNTLTFEVPVAQNVKPHLRKDNQPYPY